MLERLKRLNFKKFTRGFAIVWMIIFIVVMTITNIGIDEHFDWLKWLGSALILFGITVFGLFIGESLGNDFSKEHIVRNPEGKITGGLYQKNLFEYNTVRKSVDPIIIYFPIFYDWFVPQRLESKQINFLIMNDINPKKAANIVKYCNADDLWKLKTEVIKKEIDGKEIFIDKLYEHEIEPVEVVLKGEVKLELSGCSYYLQADAESNQKDIMEQGEYYKKAKKTNKNTARTIRLVGGAVISLALGILTVNDFAKASDGQAWMNLITRLTNLFTALLSGWLSGTNGVKIESNAIANKTDVLKLFSSAYEKHLFTLYDEDEKARVHYEEQEKKKKASVENIIDPPKIVLLSNEKKEEN